MLTLISGGFGGGLNCIVPNIISHPSTVLRRRSSLLKPRARCIDGQAQTHVYMLARQCTATPHSFTWYRTRYIICFYPNYEFHSHIRAHYILIRYILVGGVFCAVAAGTLFPLSSLMLTDLMRTLGELGNDPEEVCTAWVGWDGLAL